SPLLAADVVQIVIPAQAEPPVGLKAIERMMRSRFAAPRGAPAAARSAGNPRLARADAAALVRTLTIVGGKGGVGKSTVACALAIAAVDADRRRTLLVSTDPAPSLADALGASAAEWARRDVEHDVGEVDGLVVRQMDATAAFARLRDDYQSRTDELFAALVG